MVVLAPHGEVAKTLPVVRLATHKPIVSVDAGKHMATVLPNFVLARHLQRLENFVTDKTGCEPFLSFVLCPPTHIVPFGKFHRMGGAQPKTFPMLSMMPLKRCVASENVLTPVLGNEVLSKLFM